MSDDIENDTNDNENNSSDGKRRRKEVNLLRHTETIDNLKVKNVNLQKDLEDAETEIDILVSKLENNHIKIPKSMFYLSLIFAGYLFYVANTQLNDFRGALIEINVTIKEYKDEIEKTKLYNSILEKKLKIENTDNN